MLSELPANLVITMVIVPLLQWAKRSQSPLLTLVNERTAFAISGLIAFLAALGIHYSFDPSVGRLVIDGLQFPTIVAGGLEWLKQFAAQHWGHRLYRTLEIANGKV